MNPKISILTKTNRFIIAVLFLCAVPDAALSQTLKADSVYPTLGETGKALNVTVKGTGFDSKNTRVSMYLDIGNTKAIIGSADIPDSAEGIFIADNRAYLAAGSGGLQIVDISDPKYPKVIKSLVTPGSASDVFVAGTTVYLAAKAGGLQIIDIQDISNPKIIGSITMPGWAFDVFVADGKAYIADGDSGLQIVTVSDSSNLEIIGSADTPGLAYGVVFADGKAYMADWDGGFQIFDVSNPSSPKIIGSANTDGLAKSIFVSGGKAYLSDVWRGLQIFDIADPSNPKIIGSVDTPGNAYDVFVIGDRAYLADNMSGFQILDVADPSKPKIIGTADTPGDAYSLFVANEKAYIADGESGLQIIDIGDMSNSANIPSVSTPGDAYGIFLADRKAYIADSGLQVIDISDESNPKIIGSADTPGESNDIKLLGDKAYIADGDSGLQVIDISNPSNPQIVGSEDTPGSANDIFVTGDKAYIADGNSGLQVIDISNPSNPEIIGSADTPGSAYGVFVSGDKAYIADVWNGLQVIDISNPSQPKIIASADTPGYAWDVFVSENKAYIADWKNGLQIADIADPSNPKIIGSVNMPYFAQSVFVADNRAYVTDIDSVQVVDITDPAKPQIIGSANTPKALNVVVENGKAYIAGGDFFIVSLPVEITPVVKSETELSLSLPSPQTSGNYTLRIFNGTDSYELKGAVTFADASGFQEQQEKRAIIVAGKKSASDSLWRDTQKCTKYAYLSLLTQGYTRERVYFLSPDNTDIDGDGNLNDIDGDTSKAGLQKTISDRALDSTGELLIYMTDHGGNGTFYLNEKEIMKAEELDGWLDDFQTKTSARVILIYDACMSGSFIPLMKPPEGKERIIMTSSGPDEYAWFQNSGILSFSYQFWSSIFLNAKLYDSFTAAADIMKSEQTAYLDADGDGVGYLPDDMDIPRADKVAAKKIIIGRGRVAASAPPAVASVSEEQTLNGETSAILRAENIMSLNPVVRVWAVITPPDMRYAPEDPVTDLPAAELTDPDGDGTYQGVWKGFCAQGTYRIAVYAAAEGATEKDLLYSAPLTTSVIQTKGTSAPKGDLDRNGEIGLADAVIALKIASGTAWNFWYDYAVSGIDVNGDGKAGIHEAVYILNEAAR